jgi:nucleoside-diphosphate-sugar epimerase
MNTTDLISEDFFNIFNHHKNHPDNLQALKNSIVVITGGTGFMGTWLTGMLTYLNDHYNFNIEIWVIARNKPGNKFHRKDIKIIQSDIRYLMEFPSQTKWIIHCAATPDNRFHASNPVETMNIIAQGTYAVLRAAERCSHLQTLLNVSSGLIYGSQPIDLLQIEETHQGSPKCDTVSSAYAEAKRYAETLCNAARSQSRIPVVTVRPFAFIGPHQSLNRPWALNNFLSDAMRSQPVRVMGDGKTVRSYLYASDMAFWLLKILTHSNSGEIYNMGSSEEINLNELAQMIAKEVSPRLDVQTHISPAAHLKASRFIPDVSRVKKQLHLIPTISLHEAVKRTLLWHKTQSK